MAQLKADLREGSPASLSVTMGGVLSICHHEHEALKSQSYLFDCCQREAVCFLRVPPERGRGRRPSALPPLDGQSAWSCRGRGGCLPHAEIARGLLSSRSLGLCPAPPMHAAGVSGSLKSFWMLGSHLRTDSSIRCKTLPRFTVSRPHFFTAAPVGCPLTTRAFLLSGRPEGLSLLRGILTVMCLHMAF